MGQESFPDATTVGAFNMRDAARYVGLGESRMQDLIKSEEIAVRRFGRRIIIARAELDRWLGG